MLEDQRKLDQHFGKIDWNWTCSASLLETKSGFFDFDFGLHFDQTCRSSTCWKYFWLSLLLEVLKNISNLLLKERFANIDKIGEIKCPILLIHGQEDELIDFRHAEELANGAKEKGGKAKLEIRPEMRHNTFSLFQDVINPINTFWKEEKLIVNPAFEINEEALLSHHQTVTLFLSNNLLSRPALSSNTSIA